MRQRSTTTRPLTRTIGVGAPLVVATLGLAACSDAQESTGSEGTVDAGADGPVGNAPASSGATSP